MGFPPISTIGFGRVPVSSDIRVPRPPAKITTFIDTDILDTDILMNPAKIGFSALVNIKLKGLDAERETVRTVGSF